MAKEQVNQILIDGAKKLTDKALENDQKANKLPFIGTVGKYLGIFINNDNIADDIVEQKRLYRKARVQCDAAKLLLESRR